MAPKSAVWTRFCEGVSANLQDCFAQLRNKAVEVKEKISTVSKKRWALVLSTFGALCTFLGMLLAAALMPSATKTEALAIWTAHKDFLGWCESELAANRTLTPSCRDTLARPLDPPPVIRLIRRATITCARDRLCQLAIGERKVLYLLNAGLAAIRGGLYFVSVLAFTGLLICNGIILLKLRNKIRDHADERFRQRYRRNQTYGLNNGPSSSHAELELGERYWSDPLQAISGSQGSSAIDTGTPSTTSGMARRRLVRKGGVPNMLSVAEAMYFKKRGSIESLGHPDFMSVLEQRDHMFIVDDSTSMQGHWNSLTALFGTLAYMVKEGILTPWPFSSSTAISALQKLIEDQKPTGYTDMSICLGKILNKHRLKLMEQRAKHPYWKRGNTAPVRPLSIYVLTDGNWQPGCDLAPSIESLVETMLSLGMKRSQVGIQFISFGDDKDGLERLAYLENLQRRENLGLDIVDTEPSDGNVWKMLLGTIDSSFDENNGESEPPTIRNPIRLTTVQ